MLQDLQCAARCAAACSLGLVWSFSLLSINVHHQVQVHVGGSLLALCGRPFETMPRPPPPPPFPHIRCSCWNRPTLAIQMTLLLLLLLLLNITYVRMAVVVVVITVVVFAMTCPPDAFSEPVGPGRGCSRGPGRVQGLGHERQHFPAHPGRAGHRPGRAKAQRGLGGGSAGE